MGFDPNRPEAAAVANLLGISSVHYLGNLDQARALLWYRNTCHHLSSRCLDTSSTLSSYSSIPESVQLYALLDGT